MKLQFLVCHARQAGLVSRPEKHDFYNTITDGIAMPDAAAVPNSRLNAFIRGSAALLMLAGAGGAYAGPSSFSTIYSFQDGADGAKPVAPVIVGVDGYLYGTTTTSYTMLGGSPVNLIYPGTVFKLTPGGTETSLYYFGEKGPTAFDGITPDTRLVRGPDGSLYGATLNNVNSSCSYCGMVFKIAPDGSESIINSFTSPAFTVLPIGQVSELSLGDDGLLYGAVGSGGTTSCGFIYRMTTDGIVDPDWGFTFGNSAADGCHPSGGLLRASDGNFYGLTSGSIFRITPQGQFTTLYSGKVSDFPASVRLVQGGDGALYGVSFYGGDAGMGTIYRATLDGGFSTVYQFQGMNDGFSPYGDLAVGQDGALYGVSLGRGFFKFTSDGQLTTLGQYGFNGAQAPSSLTPDGFGNFYTATQAGGQYGWGSVSLFTPATPDVLASASISATAATVTVGGSTTISWNSSNANLCQGKSGGYLGSSSPTWNFNNATSGSFIFNAVPTSNNGVGTETFWIECQNRGIPMYWTTRSVSINVVPKPPSVTLTASPATVALSDSITLSWTSVNVTSCSASGAWSGSESTSGTQSVKTTQVGSSSYTLTCTGNDGSTVSSTALVNVTAPPPPTLYFYGMTPNGLRPTVNISLGQAAELHWTTTYARACKAGGSWSGGEAARGVATVTPTATGTYVYSLGCAGLLSGTTSGSVNVVVH